MKIDEKIKKINKTPATSKLQALKTDSAMNIEAFWEEVVGPMLPDYETMKKWHKLLVEYVSLPDAVYMIRKGNEESDQYMETVPADALRRGFLTKTDAGFWFVYNDNAFATLVLAMVLDNDIIDTLTAKELLTYLQTPNAIIRFHRSGKGGVEKKKAYYKIDGRQPNISPNGYTVAHIFDVNGHYYDKALGFYNAGGEDVLRAPNVNIDKGMYSDYLLQGNVDGKDIYFRDNYHPGADARALLKAHMLRFLHPLNYFCAPKDNMNGYVYCEFTNHITNKCAKRISGYEHLLYYAHHKFKDLYGDIYEDFLRRIMLPENPDDFFEKSIATPDYYGSEKIAIQYGNPLLVTSGAAAVTTTPGSEKPTSSTARTAKAAGTMGDDFADFEAYAGQTGVSNPAGYSSFIRRIMAELGIKTLSELADHIDEALDYCTQKIEGTSDRKIRHRYSNYRAALRKFKRYLQEKADNVSQADVFLNDLEDSMRRQQLAERSVYIYRGKIEELLESGWSVDDICGGIDELIRSYRKGGSRHDPKDHGNMSAALGKVAKMVKRPYIRCKRSWDSWRFMDEHVTDYCIDGDVITYSKEAGWNPKGQFVAKIDAKDMKELIAILEEAKYYGLFGRSNSYFVTVHGRSTTYDYQYAGMSGNNCDNLFGDGPRADGLRMRYNALLEKIAK